MIYYEKLSGLPLTASEALDAIGRILEALQLRADELELEIASGQGTLMAAQALESLASLEPSETASVCGYAIIGIGQLPGDEEETVYIDVEDAAYLGWPP